LVLVWLVVVIAGVAVTVFAELEIIEGSCLAKPGAKYNDTSSIMAMDNNNSKKNEYDFNDPLF
jgi:hypothetical protein